VIASTAGYYQVQEVALGRFYKGRPEIVAVQRTCGERRHPTDSTIDCDICGADHEAVIRERLEAARRLEEGKIHPWRYYAGHDEEAGLSF
jgi:hypothetical protein